MEEMKWWSTPKIPWQEKQQAGVHKKNSRQVNLQIYRKIQNIESIRIYLDACFDQTCKFKGILYVNYEWAIPKISFCWTEQWAIHNHYINEPIKNPALLTTIM